MTIVQFIAQILVLLIAPPLMQGVINRTKAICAGRRGPPLLQPYRDLARLMQKGMVISRTTTWVFLAGPVVSWATTLLAAMLLPLGADAAPFSFGGDLVLFAYLLALGRFFTVLAALDTGSSFEGMGAAREATFSAMAEPALFLALLASIRLTGETSLAGALIASSSLLFTPEGAPLALVVISLFIVLLAENSRIPFDDPNTHLELTMIHEVMVLDHSGPALGMILHGAAIKLFVYSAIVVRLALPFDGVSPALDWLIFGAGTLLVAVLVGLIESTIARLMLPSVPRLLVSACLLSAFGLILITR